MYNKLYLAPNKKINCFYATATLCATTFTFKKLGPISIV